MKTYQTNTWVKQYIFITHNYLNIFFLILGWIMDGFLQMLVAMHSGTAFSNVFKTETSYFLPPNSQVLLKPKI